MSQEKYFVGAKTLLLFFNVENIFFFWKLDQKDRLIRLKLNMLESFSRGRQQIAVIKMTIGYELIELPVNKHEL